MGVAFVCRFCSCSCCRSALHHFPVSLVDVGVARLKASTAVSTVVAVCIPDRCSAQFRTLNAQSQEDGFETAIRGQQNTIHLL